MKFNPKIYYTLILLSIVIISLIIYRKNISKFTNPIYVTLNGNERDIILDKYYEFNNLKNFLQHEVVIKRLKDSTRLVIQKLTDTKNLLDFFYQKNFGIKNNKLEYQLRDLENTNSMMSGMLVTHGQSTSPRNTKYGFILRITKDNFKKQNNIAHFTIDFTKSRQKQLNNLNKIKEIVNSPTYQNQTRKTVNLFTQYNAPADIQPYFTKGTHDKDIKTVIRFLDATNIDYLRNFPDGRFNILDNNLNPVLTYCKLDNPYCGVNLNPQGNIKGRDKYVSGKFNHRVGEYTIIDSQEYSKYKENKLSRNKEEKKKSAEVEIEIIKTKNPTYDMLTFNQRDMIKKYDTIFYQDLVNTKKAELTAKPSGSFSDIDIRFISENNLGKEFKMSIDDFTGNLLQQTQQKYNNMTEHFTNSVSNQNEYNTIEFTGEKYMQYQQYKECMSKENRDSNTRKMVSKKYSPILKDNPMIQKDKKTLDKINSQMGFKCRKHYKEKDNRYFYGGIDFDGYTKCYGEGNSCKIFTEKKDCLNLKKDLTNQIEEFTGYSNIEKKSGKGEDYRGFQSKTVTGKTCQNWSKDTPIDRHQSVINAYNNKKYGIGDHNYCRNPEGAAKEKDIWCYVLGADYKTIRGRWEFCQTLDDDRVQLHNEEKDKLKAVGTTQITSIENTGKEEKDKLKAEGTTQITSIENTGKEEKDKLKAVGTTQITEIQETGKEEKDKLKVEGTTQKMKIRETGKEEAVKIVEQGDHEVELIKNASKGEIKTIEEKGKGEVTNIETKGTTQIKTIEDKGKEEAGKIKTQHDKISKSMIDSSKTFQETVEKSKNDVIKSTEETLQEVKNLNVKQQQQEILLNKNLLKLANEKKYKETVEKMRLKALESDEQKKLSDKIAGLNKLVEFDAFDSSQAGYVGAELEDNYQKYNFLNCIPYEREDITCKHVTKNLKFNMESKEINTENQKLVDIITVDTSQESNIPEILQSHKVLEFNTIQKELLQKNENLSDTELSKYTYFEINKPINYLIEPCYEEYKNINSNIIFDGFQVKFQLVNILDSTNSISGYTESYYTTIQIIKNNTPDSYILNNQNSPVKIETEDYIYIYLNNSSKNKNNIQIDVYNKDNIIKSTTTLYNNYMKGKFGDNISLFLQTNNQHIFDEISFAEQVGNLVLPYDPFLEVSVE